MAGQNHHWQNHAAPPFVGLLVRTEFLLNAGPGEARFVVVSVPYTLDGAGVLGQRAPLVPGGGHTEESAGWNTMK